MFKNIALMISLTTLGPLLASNGAKADDCDYVGRHNRANIRPLSLAVSLTPRSGDIPGGQQLKIHVDNPGENPVDYQAQPGDLFHALIVYVRLKGVDYQGYLRAPLNPGASADLLVNVPAGTIHSCEDVTLTIDSRHTAHQWGCNVYGDDTKTFPRIRVIGERYPICDIIRHPGGGHFPHLDDAQGEDNGEAEGGGT